MSFYSRTQASLANASAQQLAVYAVTGTAALWIIGKLLRELGHVLFPNVLPGEPNTALLASARPRSKQRIEADDFTSNVVEYDYIIVGTGTAGCVLANRLTEDPAVTVLAIEAGHSDLKQIFSRIPAGFGRLFKSAADYNLWTTPQANCKSRQLQWPRGKMLGGCSSINAMIYNKGSPDDYEEWVKLGNKGWSYKELVPYMTKAEGFTQSKHNMLPAPELAQHGRTGPWKVGYSYCSSLSKILVDGIAAVGIPKVTDFNSDKGIQGAGLFQCFIDPLGQRSSAAVAYLTEKVCRRSNLKIATGQTVTRIVFDTASGKPKAVGVVMASDSKSVVQYLAKARREVILSAGAVHSPQILKLSGIGPAAELKKHDIKVIRELDGVGANMSDHIFSSFVAKCKSPSLQYLTHQVKSLPALIEWFRFGTGALTSNIAESGAFIRTADRKDAPESLRSDDLSSGPNSADLEILSGSCAYISHGAVLPSAGDYFSIGPIILRPSSRGTVTLASTDPFSAPIVDANYLSTQHDLDLMTYGLKLTRDIIRTEHLQKIFDGYYWPRENCDALSDVEMQEIVRETCETIYHPMGTAAMGPATDKAAVVDNRLRVHGVEGLRIVDASIFPTPLACHPCAPVIMTGEKAADLIKEDWK